MGIKHKFVSVIAEGADAGKVRVSNWNADHTIDGDIDLNDNGIVFTSVTVEDVLDEDDLVSDSATKLATQQSIKAYVDNNTREVLAADRTYYVRDADGSDANTGLIDSAAGAFLTIQHAVNIVAALDTSIYNITIDLGDGTYSESVACLNILGSGTVTIQGNAGTPANVIIDGTVSKSVPGTQYTCKDLKLLDSAGADIGLYAYNNAQISFGNLVFSSGFVYQIYAKAGGIITCVSNYEITDDATYHIFATQQGYIKIESRTVLLTGVPAFTAYIKADRISTIFGGGGAFTNTATGKRYESNTNSLVSSASGGANYFPGDSAGTTATGGLYE